MLSRTFAQCARILALAAALLATACAHPAWALVGFEEVKREFRSSDTAVLDRNGELLQRVRTDATVRRGQWIALADVSPALRTAMVLSEDRRFYEHSGIDGIRVQYSSLPGGSIEVPDSVRRHAVDQFLNG